MIHFSVIENKSKAGSKTTWLYKAIPYLLPFRNLAVMMLNTSERLVNDFAVKLDSVGEFDFRAWRLAKVSSE